MILDALARLPEATELTARAAEWLLAQKRPDWRWGDTLAETFLALTALRHYNSLLIPAEALGAAVRLLLAAEEQPGGPYRSRLDKAGVDLFTNAVIAVFLKRQGSDLPKLRAYIYGMAAANQWDTSGYPALLVRYYVEGAYPEFSALHGVWRSPRQQADGSWRVIGMAGHEYAAVITAFVLAKRSVPDTPKPAAETRQDGHAARLRRSIIQAAERDINALPSPLRTTARSVVGMVTRFENVEEILLLGRLFAKSLTAHPAVDDALFKATGLGNLYAWTAYTVFDDFLDDEGRAIQLPAASMALRRSLHYFHSALPGVAEWPAYVEQVFDTIDAANTWELEHGRFAVQDGMVEVSALPSFVSARRLYERSLAHCLPTIAILVAAGRPLDDLSTRAVRQAFSYYLAARQLGDDLHDWEEDARRGQINFAVAAIMRDMKLAPGPHRLDELVPRMREQFWDHSFVPLAKIMKHYIQYGRKELDRSALVAPNSPVYTLFAILEASLQHTYQEHTAGHDFLRGLSAQFDIMK